MDDLLMENVVAHQWYKVETVEEIQPFSMRIVNVIQMIKFVLNALMVIDLIETNIVFPQIIRQSYPIVSNKDALIAKIDGFLRIKVTWTVKTFVEFVKLDIMWTKPDNVNKFLTTVHQQVQTEIV